MSIASRTVFVGDNLPVLRGMEAGSVDMVYADPPFNSNRSYAAPIGSKAAGAMFRDTWSLNDVDKAWPGEIRGMMPAVSAIVETAGLSAGAGMQSYLTMMAVRLIELRRILHERGAFFLHCDSTAAAYLKVLCDSIFGFKRFRNEIIWKRNSSHNDARAFGRVTDTILFYGGSDIRAEAVRVPLDAEYVKRKYRHKDTRGLYMDDNLTAKGLGGGRFEYEFHGHYGPWRYQRSSMLELEREDRIHLPKKPGGIPRLKRYLDENKGQIPSNLWADIPPINSRAKERTGYPTQKPLALLRRLIAASTEPGETVLDPFAGCATALVAAEESGRQWIGIDVSPVAVRLVQERMRDELGLFGLGVVERMDIPRRKGKRSKNIRELLYGKQAGDCNLCREHFALRNLAHVRQDTPLPEDPSPALSSCGSSVLYSRTVAGGTPVSARTRRSRETRPFRDRLTDPDRRATGTDPPPAAGSLRRVTPDGT